MRLYWLLHDPRRTIIGWLTFASLGAFIWIFYSVVMYFQGEASIIEVGLGVPLATVVCVASVAGLKYLH